MAVRRISDLLCAEHGLSVIENPKQSKGSYGDWLGDNKKPSNRDKLKIKIDEILPLCETFNDFLNKLAAEGYEVNTQRKYISVKGPGWGKPARLDTLKGDYTEAAIRARIGKTKIISGGGDSGRRDSTPDVAVVRITETRSAPNLLIDIQAKIQQGKGAGVLRYRGCKSYTLYFIRQHKRLRHTDGL
jgi:hypothetical protein